MEDKRNIESLTFTTKKAGSKNIQVKLEMTPGVLEVFGNLFKIGLPVLGGFGLKTVLSNIYSTPSADTLEEILENISKDIPAPPPPAEEAEPIKPKTSRQIFEECTTKKRN